MPIDRTISPHAPVLERQAMAFQRLTKACHVALSRALLAVSPCLSRTGGGIRASRALSGCTGWPARGRWLCRGNGGLRLARWRIRRRSDGLADVESTAPMIPQSRMLAASIGKTSVAATVLALAQEQWLSLEDLATKWLGEQLWFTRLANHDMMTVRHLVTHTAGPPDRVNLPSFA